ncbi:hypothetical protein BJX70DRAFT_374962 [Aspergillus crustosus]
MRSFLVLTTLFTTLLSTALAYDAVREELPCREDEEYIDCANYCSRWTCENFNMNPQYCHTQCFTGCFCLRPNVRAEDGSCIPQEECPSPSDD